MNDILKELSEILVLEDDGMGGNRVFARVTPDMARKLLSLSGGNRPLSNATVNKYKRHMERGTWDESTPTQFITFTRDGVLINGHHTLKALTRCGRDIKLYFMFNANPSAYYDCGRRRSEADRLCMSEGSRDGFRGYSRAIAMCNVLNEVGIQGMVTEEERKQFILQNILAVDWATSNLKMSKHRLSTAPVRTALFMKKMSGVPAHSLEHFWEVLQSGYSETPNDRTIIRLRDWMVSLGDSRSRVYRREVLFTVMDVIDKWVAGKAVRTIVPIHESVAVAAG